MMDQTDQKLLYDNLWDLYLTEKGRKMTKVKKTTTVTVEEYDDTPVVKKPLNIHVLIDNSGSMASWTDKTVSSINEYIMTMKKQAISENIDMKISMSLFSDIISYRTFENNISGVYTTLDCNIQTLINNVPIALVEPVNSNQIRPAGGTPLYDAIGRTVNSIPRNTEELVALVIITDGEENASKEYTRTSIKHLLSQKQENDNWLIQYLGANQDAFAEGGNMGTQRGYTMNYSMNNMNQAFHASAMGATRFVASGIASAAAYSEQERDSAVGKVDDKTT